MGFVNIKRIRNDVDNIGAYLVSYLTDFSEDEFHKLFPDCKLPSDSVEKNIDGETKRFVKNMRLVFYPVGFHPFRFSQNCIPPIVEKVRYSDAQKQMGDNCVKFTEWATEIIDDDSDFYNVVQHELYKQIRVKESDNNEHE